MVEELNLIKIQKKFQEIQNNICNFLVKITGENYHEDVWNYEKGEGGGITRIWNGEEIENQNKEEVIEKGGVNYSSIKGFNLPSSALNQITNINKNLKDKTFVATGVSLVIHPKNPNIPTIHMNIRYFEIDNGNIWWFGGGIDLTPYIPNKIKIIQFHKFLQEICIRNQQNYDDFKKQCDEYFYLKHRKESRGVGGIFFDHLFTNEKNPFSKEKLWNFIEDLGKSFINLYEPFIQKDIQEIPYTPNEREFQLIRRSRYVEFNLVYDRGTTFGLQSGGRTESILMSMPSIAKWKYNWKPKPNTLEYEMVHFYLQPQDWIHMNI